MASGDDQEATAIEDVEEDEIRKVKTFMKKFYDLWTEFGIDAYRQSRRSRVVWSHVQNLLLDMFDEESTYYVTLQQRVKNYTKEIQDLSKALSINPREASGTLVQREEQLRNELTTMKKLKHKRVKMYQHLKNAESKYCKILQLEEGPASSDTVPSDSELSELKQRVSKLKKERDSRLLKFCLIKKELTTILETTELEPETLLGKEIFGDKRDVCLSDETFRLLDKALSEVQKRTSELQAQKEKMMSQLESTWELLKIEQGIRDEFKCKHCECRTSTLASIQLELDHYEKMKMEQMKGLINSLRIELEQLWSRCFVSDCEKKLFQLYSASEVSQDVLESYEKEVKKWKCYYEEMKHILKKIHQRQLLWEKMVMLENKSSDPSRYKNRGGSLLQEEKERKKLQKDLPTLENDIFHNIEVYESQGRKLFSYFGEDFRIYVSNQWTQRMDQKENKKIERQKSRLSQTDMEVKTNTPIRRPAKVIPKTAPSKFFKSQIGLSVCRTPLKMNSKNIPATVGRFNRKLFQSPLVTPKQDPKRSKEMSAQKSAITFNGTTYSDFSKELNCTARLKFQSSFLKPGGAKLQPKSAKQNRSKTPGCLSPLTPVRGKLGLPFLI